MACSSPSDNRTAQRMTALERQVRSLTQQFKFFQEITGTCTPPGGAVTDIYSNEYDSGTGVFTIVFASEPGQFFQVQQSTDLTTWVIAEDGVQAAVTPAISTEWESASFDLDDLPIYFRIRRLPRVFVACPTSETVSCPWILNPAET